MTVWVFGYGSLVSPASIGVTIQRDVTPGVGYEAATLDGYGRRWNYGSLRQRADWRGEHGPVQGGVVVSLGVAEAPGEWANGAIIEVSADELVGLDRRESDYDRVDVSIAIRGNTIRGNAGRTVVTYVPRPSAIARFEQHRSARTAAVRAGYVRLVEEAFDALGSTHLDDYRASTPAPDVPVVEFESVWLDD